MTKERPHETKTRFDDRDHEYDFLSNWTTRSPVTNWLQSLQFPRKANDKVEDNISKRDYKLHLSYRLVQFGFVENFTCAYYAKLREKSRYYLLIMYMKNITESQDRQHFESLYAFCNLHPCYNFALVLHQNALVFSQSKARDKKIIQIPRSFVAF